MLESLYQDKFLLVAIVLLGLFTVLLGLISLIFFYRIRRNYIWRKQSEYLEIGEVDVFAFLYGEKSIAELRIVNNAATRNYIACIAARLSGYLRQKLLYLYETKGFLYTDLAYLKNGNRRQQVEALNRLRDFEFDLPKAGWEHLLADKNDVFRWASTEFLIAAKKERSLLWLTPNFNRSNVKSGVILHLIACMAKVSSELPLILLCAAEDESVKIACLRALSAYPNSRAKDSIVAVLKKAQSEEMFIAAVKSLIHYSDEDLLPIYHKCIEYSHWVVRLYVATAMKNYSLNQTKDLLELLARDSNYFIRLEVVNVLRESEEGLAIIDYLKTQSDHPAFELFDVKDSMGEVA